MPECQLERVTTRDAELRERARRVVPGGVYGHQTVETLPQGFPQFYARGAGSRLWDVDGNEYIDYMCGFGPIVLGHRHAAVERAVRAISAGDCFNAPGEQWVELAELLVDTVAHADWAWFAKNGTDATTWAVTLARAHTGRKVLLRAEGAYHGSAPWCTPRLDGTTPEDRANQLTYRYNDLASVEAAVDRAGDDLAAIITSPFRHDARFDQEDVDPAFARGLRRICDATGAVLILDEVRAGFRLDVRGSWEPLGVRPDVSAFSKAIGNGYPISAVVAREELREAATRIYATGSFWFQPGPMAAASATIQLLCDPYTLTSMWDVGQLLRDGLARQAEEYGLRIRQTGPVVIPFLTFVADTESDTLDRANLFCSEAVTRGVYLHPWHNWFLCAAHTAEDVERTLAVTNEAFRAVRERFGEG
jgi:glutamate-1-semialdehyde 2,1-aminomutase